MRRTGVAVAGALAGALAAGLAGCGSSSTTADPSSPVPLTASPSTGTPSASPSLDPNSDAAILAAVQAYAAAVTAVGRTASTAGLSDVVTASCPCLVDQEALASKLQADGRHLDSTITATNARILRRTATNADVLVTLGNATYHVLDASGAVVGNAPAQTSASTISVSREGASWLVSYVRLGSQ